MLTNIVNSLKSEFCNADGSWNELNKDGLTVQEKLEVLKQQFGNFMKWTETVVLDKTVIAIAYCNNYNLSAVTILVL